MYIEMGHVSHKNQCLIRTYVWAIHEVNILVQSSWDQKPLKSFIFLFICVFEILLRSSSDPFMLCFVFSRNPELSLSFFTPSISSKVKKKIIIIIVGVVVVVIINIIIIPIIINNNNDLGGGLLSTVLALLLGNFCGRYFVIRCFLAFYFVPLYL